MLLTHIFVTGPQLVIPLGLLFFTYHMSVTGVLNHRKLYFFYQQRVWAIITGKTKAPHYLPFVMGNCRWPVGSPHKEPVMWKAFSCHASSFVAVTSINPIKYAHVLCCFDVILWFLDDIGYNVMHTKMRKLPSLTEMTYIQILYYICMTTSMGFQIGFWIIDNELWNTTIPVRVLIVNYINQPTDNGSKNNEWLQFNFVMSLLVAHSFRSAPFVKGAVNIYSILIHWDVNVGELDIEIYCNRTLFSDTEKFEPNFCYCNKRISSYPSQCETKVETTTERLKQVYLTRHDSLINMMLIYKRIISVTHTTI